METVLDFVASRMPPPAWLGRSVALVPTGLRQQLMARQLDRFLQSWVAEDEWQLLEGRVLAIEVTDLCLVFMFECRNQQLVSAWPDTTAATTIRGCGGDLLMLAARLEDADTLFFERRLEVCGDTATGLLLRNLLDRLPADALPLPPRILLNRLARFSARLRRVRQESGKPAS
jgi:O2-independent ubiquinone biosynthesis accessory factor UbiT